MAPSKRKSPAKTADGRTPGRRGQATREKLLACTEKLLQKTSYRDLTVMEIARCAGTSPATFYQYFSDVVEAVLVLAERMSDEGSEIAAIISDGDWDANAHKTSFALVDAFLAMWERHRVLLRVVDLSTAEGDLRFQSLRTHLLNQVTVGLRDQIASFKSSKTHPRDLDPMAHAASIVSMLAHVAQHQYGLEFWGIRTEQMRRSLARLVAYAVTGSTPSP